MPCVSALILRSTSGITRRGSRGASEGAGAEQQRVEAPDRIRVVRGHDVSEPASGEPGFVDPQDLVGHREDQSAALFVGEERAESLASAALCT